MKDYEKAIKLLESITFGTGFIDFNFTVLVHFLSVLCTYNGHACITLFQYLCFFSVYT